MGRIPIIHGGPFRAAFRRKDTAFAEHTLALPENGRAKIGLFKMGAKKGKLEPEHGVDTSALSDFGRRLLEGRQRSRGELRCRVRTRGERLCRLGGGSRRLP